MKPKILLVDDEEIILDHMRRALGSDYEVLTSLNEEEALRIFELEKPPVVVLDLSLIPQDPSDLGGMRLLEQMLAKEPSTRVIMVTGNNHDANALMAVRLGAWDYYTKPVRLEELKVMIQRALHIHHLQRRLQRADTDYGPIFHGIVGQSPQMRKIFRFIECVAVSDIPVLVSGESGTGKEMVAHAIHQQSRRQNGPFVTVNCGAVPEHLLESELFGHEKSAFTGAHARKRGKFELAHTGTLFLDEIGELTPALQVKLLRFLQDRKIERVGGSLPIKVDVRIIAATNHNLEKNIESRVFREDLYYLLKVAPVDLPPLRERKDDIIPLAQFFLQKFSREHRKPLKTLSFAAEGVLSMHSWPGNVRELENLINRVVVLSPYPALKPSDLGFALDQIPTDVNLKFAKRAIEVDFIKKALTRNRGVVSRAARDLGISRVNLYELLQRYSICLQEFKSPRPSRNTQKQMNPQEMV